MKMTFGKYRGTPVKQLPSNYLEWLTSIDVLEGSSDYEIKPNKVNR